MATNNHLIIEWHSGGSIVVYSANGVEKQIKFKGMSVLNILGGVSEGQQEFLSLLDEYGNLGWDLVDISTIPLDIKFMIRAFLRKQIA